MSPTAHYLPDVKDQYEALPYPARNPADEGKRLVNGAETDAQRKSVNTRDILTSLPHSNWFKRGEADRDAALHFHRDGLGFATEGIVGQEFDHGAVVFIDLQPGLRLAPWPRSSIAHDTGLAAGPANPTEVTLGHNLASRAEVDAAMAAAKAAGATIVKPAYDTFWAGYSGYFQDPDGHLWEVVWNPQ